MIYRKLTHIPQGNTYTITTRIPHTHTHTDSLAVRPHNSRAFH